MDVTHKGILSWVQLQPTKRQFIGWLFQLITCQLQIPKAQQDSVYYH